MAEDLTEYFADVGVQGALPALGHRRDRAHRRSSATCAGASSTCWSASTCCAKAWTSPRCRWWRSSTPTRKASCARHVSLIQTIGRAARNLNGRVIMYADQHHRLDEARDRGDRPPPRGAARATTSEHGITPRSVKKNILDLSRVLYDGDPTALPMAAEARTTLLAEGRDRASSIARELRSEMADARRRAWSSRRPPQLRDRCCCSRTWTWASSRRRGRCSPAPAGSRARSSAPDGQARAQPRKYRRKR